MNRIKWIAYGYFALLVAGSILLYVLAGVVTTQETILDSSSIEQIRKTDQAFYDAAINGYIAQAEGVVFQGSKSFDYPHNKLTLTTPEPGQLDLWIVIERKASDDHKVDVSHYATRSLLGSLEVTDRIPPVQLELSGESLWLAKPDAWQLKLAQFRQEFTIRQFATEDGAGLASLGGSAVLGHRAVYLQVPPDLEIIDETLAGLIYVD